MSKNGSIIRRVYLYLVTAITIVILLIGFIGLFDLVLKEYVLDVKGWEELENNYWECNDPVPIYNANGEVEKPVEDKMTDEEMEECIANAKEKRELTNKNNLKRDLAQYLAMIIVALPLYLYHWGVIKKEK